MGLRRKIRIGELLVENGVITSDQLETALVEQKKTGRKLGRTFIELGYVGEDEFIDFLSRQLGVPRIDLSGWKFDPELVQRLPESHARRLRAIVLAERADGYLVGMADPTNLFGVDELGRLLKRQVEIAVVREADLLRSIDAFYRRTGEIQSLAHELREELRENEIDVGQLLDSVESADAPVARLLQSIFEDAVQQRASDIHIEPDENVLRIRLRVDGVLQEHVVSEFGIAPALVLRLKLMASLNISEKRLPQDGRFNVRVKSKSIDVRVSTMPIQFGESVVMRLLDQSASQVDLEQIGMPAPLLRRFRALIHQPHGITLVTGPTGSGKTTTLYAALAELNSVEKKIITVEDPVEYRISRINQVQVNPKIQLQFATVLRAALRQDPDIIMVGEMRDQETAEIGVRAAMTGHLVLSTLHTNDAVSTVTRLVEMGIAGHLLAASLRGVLAQRLVRRLCPNCSVEDPLDAQKRSFLLAMAPELRERSFGMGRGCTNCNQTGYRGRLGVFELVELDTAMADGLRSEDLAAYTQAARRQPGFRPLGLYALDRAVAHQTSLDEVIRVAGEVVDPAEATPVEAAPEALA
jgi:MSHA biogenesis protein MshE